MFPEICPSSFLLLTLKDGTGSIALRDYSSKKEKVVWRGDDVKSILSKTKITVSCFEYDERRTDDYHYWRSEIQYRNEQYRNAQHLPLLLDG